MLLSTSSFVKSIQFAECLMTRSKGKAHSFLVMIELNMQGRQKGLPKENKLISWPQKLTKD